MYSILGMHSIIIEYIFKCQKSKTAIFVFYKKILKIHITYDLILFSLKPSKCVITQPRNVLLGKEIKVR